MKPAMKLFSSLPSRAKRLSRGLVILIAAGALVMFGVFPALIFARCQTVSNGVIAMITNWILPTAFGCGGGHGDYVVENTSYSLSVSNTGNGLVYSSPVGIDCGTTCDATYNSSTSVSLFAIPASDYDFYGWSGDCNGTSTCIVTMDASKSITATFNHVPTQTLTVSKTEGGTVTSDPAGINCGTTCSTILPYQSSMQLTATPDSDYAFMSWSGCNSTAFTYCDLIMDSNKSVNATFAPAYVMFFDTFPDGVWSEGYVTFNGNPNYDSDNNCSTPGPWSCQSWHPQGSTAIITVNPPTGWQIGGWGGACSGTTTSECTVLMDNNKFASVTFEEIYTLTVAVNGSGSVSSDPAGIDCPATCSATFASSTSVSLTTTPDSGYVFTGWSGDCTGSGFCTVLMGPDRSVTATFAQ